MKHNFRGWTTVFGFTFRQSTKGMAFRLVTTLVTILIIAALIIINVIVAKPDKENEIVISPIKTVFVLDQSGLQPTDYKTLNPQLSEEQFKNIAFVNVTDQTREEVVKTALADSTVSIAVIITKADKSYELEAVIPSGSDIIKDQAQAVLLPIQSAFESSKLMQSGLTVQQLTTILKPVVTSQSNIGENTNQIAYVIKMIAPMLFGLILYMMLLLYGQTISKSVSTEKTSKLMETLLTSIHPYALITGKVLAVTTIAVLQFLTWIVAAVVGLYGGNAVAHYFYPEYQNSVIAIINFLKDNIGETAMSLPAVILAILVFCVGFLFYCVIAGLAGCLVAKPEDVSSTQAVFTFPIIISWLICYIASAASNEGVLRIARFVPFTAPFCVPVDLITGTIGLVPGAISFVLLTLFSLLVIMLSARIYKGLILYSGQKISLAMIGNVIKANK
ncbi:MAG TPA: ABC transporter permease [Mobilitalea sp.]|nr:ABC transporter permease [Mobilitalea sp.]